MVQFEQSNLKWLTEYLGAEHFMWSTDLSALRLPVPAFRKFVNDLFESVSPEAAAMILEGVPARLFGFDPARLPKPQREAAT